MGNEMVVVGGLRYYVEALDLDRLYANLATRDEEATNMRLHAARNPDEPQWADKADKIDEDVRQLKELIAAKRGS